MPKPLEFNDAEQVDVIPSTLYLSGGTEAASLTIYGPDSACIILNKEHLILLRDWINNYLQEMPHVSYLIDS